MTEQFYFENNYGYVLGTIEKGIETQNEKLNSDDFHDVIADSYRATTKYPDLIPETIINTMMANYIHDQEIARAKAARIRRQIAAIR